MYGSVVTDHRHRTKASSPAIRATGPPVPISWREWLFPTKDFTQTGRVGISPNNRFLFWFDGLLVLALFLTATVTVFVVCILQTKPLDANGEFVEDDNFSQLSVRLLYDYLMDVIFLSDFFLGFFRAYREDHGRGRLVFDLREIQDKYMSKPGFTADFVSSIPYDWLVVIGTMADIRPHNLRFLRLIRLLRLHRGYRIVDQSAWYQQFTLRVDSRKLHMCQLAFGFLMVEHWASCWWVWLGKEEVLLDKRYTWVDRLEENGFVFNRSSEFDLYIVGLYWASTVSSSVGSGDIVPTNPHEAIFVALFQIMGGCLFAYAVSSLVGLYAALHALEESRGVAIDNVNEMLNELNRESAHVDIERIRSFVWQACDARQARARRRMAPGGALAQLSPQLRDEVLLAERQPWVEKFWFLAGASPRLATALCREAVWVTYAPGDHITLLYNQGMVVTRGVAATSDQVLVRGSILGVAGLATVASKSTCAGPSMLCLNFVEGLMLNSVVVDRIMQTEANKYELRRWRRAKARYGLVRWAREQQLGRVSGIAL